MDGPASADPPALAQRAGGTALANVEPEAPSHSPVSSASKDSSLQIIHWRRHAVPDTNVSACSDRAGDYGTALVHRIAVPGPKLASRGRGFPVHPAGPRSGRILGRLDEPGSIGRATRASDPALQYHKGAERRSRLIAAGKHDQCSRAERELCSRRLLVKNPASTMTQASS